MGKPTIAILGASNDRRKFGNKAVRAYLAQGFDVYPVNPNAAEVEGLKAYARLRDVPVRPLDRVSVYLPPAIAVTLLEEIRDHGTKEVWLNPGSESPEVLHKAEELGLNAMVACSIVGIGASPAAFADH